MIHSLGALPPYVSTRGLGQTLACLLLAIAVLGWIAVGCDLAAIDLAGRAAGRHPIAGGEGNAIVWTGTVLLAAQIVLFVVTAGVFLCWLYLSRANLRAFGMRRMQYPRAWTVAGFLIPALNLIRPYQVISEVWKASDPDAPDAFSWKDAEAPPVLSLWWGAMIAFMLLEATTLAIHLSTGGSAMRLQLAAATLADAAGGVGASLGFFVVSWISRAQREKWDQHAARYSLPPQ